MKKVYAMFLVLCAFAGACRPPLDNCPDNAHRCSPTGIPQECSSGRWHNADRVCGELTVDGGVAVCCETYSTYAGRVLHACVASSACLPAVDGGVR